MPCGCGKTRNQRADARVERNAQRASAAPRSRYTVTDQAGNVQRFSSYVDARRASRAVGGTVQHVDG